MELKVGTALLTALGFTSLFGVQVSMKREVGILQQESLRGADQVFSVLIVTRRIKSWFVFPLGNIIFLQLIEKTA